MMRDWFAQLILYSEALTLSGIYVPFGEIAVGALRMVGETSDVAVNDADVDEMTALIGAMPAHADVAPALEALKERGFRLVTFTNSSPGAAPTPLERAGLAHYFERTFSVHGVMRFKPAPETYRHVAKELDAKLSDLCMVAYHLWDTIGAQVAGCAAALIKRPGNAVTAIAGVPTPDIVEDDMHQLAKEIIDRWSGDVVRR
jgi:2-haloacid dehalogenase